MKSHFVCHLKLQVHLDIILAEYGLFDTDDENVNSADQGIMTWPSSVMGSE